MIKLKILTTDYSASGIRVKECAICDIEGFLNEENGERRKSVASFSWAIAKEGLYQKDVVTSSQYAMVIELDLHRIGFDEEICFKDFMNEQYTVPEIFYDFNAIAVKYLEWHINGSGIFYTSNEEPGGIDTDMYYFV